jgi:hypothetical protein
MGTFIAAFVSSAVWVALEIWRQSAHPTKTSFSLRTLLIMVTLFSLVIGFITALLRG